MSNAPSRRRPAGLPLILVASLWLVGCDQLGIESAATVAARRDADGKAVGAGCRHAARSIEQCYETNKRAERAAIFAGWREMEDYMRENKIEAIPAAPKPAAAQADGDDAAARAGKSELAAAGGEPDKLGQIDKTEAADKADKAGKLEKSARTAEKVDKSDKAIKAVATRPGPRPGS